MERVFDAGIYLKDVQKSEGDRAAAEEWYYYEWVRLCDGRKADGRRVRFMTRKGGLLFSDEEWERPMRQR